MWDTCAWGATMVMMERTTACALVTKGECATWSLRVDTFCVCVCKFRAGRKKKRKSVGADGAISNHFRFLYAPPCIPPTKVVFGTRNEIIKGKPRLWVVNKKKVSPEEMTTRERERAGEEK